MTKMEVLLVFMLYQFLILMTNWNQLVFKRIVEVKQRLEKLQIKECQTVMTGSILALYHMRIKELWRQKYLCSQKTLSGARHIHMYSIKKCLRVRFVQAPIMGKLDLAQLKVYRGSTSIFCKDKN